jgi:hypothetical protein
MPASCVSCGLTEDWCRCNKYCDECGAMTNHTGEQHRAVGPWCQDCGERITHTDDPDARRCVPCEDEQAMWRAADNYDAQAKGDDHAHNV